MPSAFSKDYAPSCELKKFLQNDRIQQALASAKTNEFLSAFNGIGPMKRAMQQMKLKCKSYDILDGDDQDILSDEGYINLICMVCKLFPESVIWWGPPCSLFIYLSEDRQFC